MKDLIVFMAIYLSLLGLIYFGLIACTTNQEIGRHCVVYQGYDQRYFRMLKVLDNGNLEVIDYKGVKSIIKDYRKYECN